MSSAAASVDYVVTKWTPVPFRSSDEPVHLTCSLAGQERFSRYSVVCVRALGSPYKQPVRRLIALCYYVHQLRHTDHIFTCISIIKEYNFIA